MHVIFHVLRDNFPPLVEGPEVREVAVGEDNEADILQAGVLAGLLLILALASFCISFQWVPPNLRAVSPLYVYPVK